MCYISRSIHGDLCIKLLVYTYTGFPNCVGLIDGTLIRIRDAVEFPEQYISRKGYPAMNVQVTKIEICVDNLNGKCNY